jgi:hypothetical protein
MASKNGGKKFVSRSTDSSRRKQAAVWVSSWDEHRRSRKGFAARDMKSCMNLVPRAFTQPTCPSDTNTPGRISAKLNGIAKEDTISLDVSGGSYTPPDMTPCPFGPQPSKAPAVYTLPHFSQIFHELKKRPDGSYHVDREWTNSGGTHPYTEHYALKLEPL